VATAQLAHTLRNRPASGGAGRRPGAPRYAARDVIVLPPGAASTARPGPRGQRERRGGTTEPGQGHPV